MNHRTQNDQTRRDRSGMSTVEFTLLLPFFALLAAGLFMTGHLFYRSVCQSDAAFTAARQCAVRGGAGSAERLVRKEYRACSMPGEPQVSARYAMGRPGICVVEIHDQVPAVLPDSRGRVTYSTRPGAVTRATAAGASFYIGGDNDR